MRQNTFTYRVNDTFELDKLAQGIEKILKSENCTTYVSDKALNYIEISGYLGQVGIINKITGTEKGLCVTLKQDGQRLEMVLSNAPINDKIIGFGLAALGAEILAVTSIVGIFCQERMRNRVIGYVNRVVL